MARRWTEAALDREAKERAREFITLGDGLYLRLPSEVFYYRVKPGGIDRRERLGRRDRTGQGGLTLKEARRIAAERNTEQAAANPCASSWRTTPVRARRSWRSAHQGAEGPW